jgi:hypothetical protein
MFNTALLATAAVAFPMFLTVFATVIPIHLREADDGFSGWWKTIGRRQILFR